SLRDPTPAERRMPLHRSRHRSSLIGSSGEFRDRLFQRADHQGKAIVFELVGSVGAFVIMRITEGRGVGDHDRGITALPERPLIRPRYARNESWKRNAFGWDFPLFAKEADRPADKRARRKISDEPNEVPGAGIEGADARRIFLRPRRVGKISDGFQ